jgi:DNA polymerase III epsilon subunit-like protein
MPKVFWFDCETTGTIAGKHEAHQIAYAIEVDGKVVENGQLWVQPTRWETIEAEALAVSGVTVEILKTAKYEPVEVVHRKLTAILARYVDKFNRADKYYPAGYSVL